MVSKKVQRLHAGRSTLRVPDSGRKASRPYEVEKTAGDPSAEAIRDPAKKILVPHFLQ
jgi:hypothetical protein